MAEIGFQPVCLQTQVKGLAFCLKHLCLKFGTSYLALPARG